MSLAPDPRAVPDRPLRLGIYGGTFDPVHLGHMIVARDALEQLQLDELIFMPCQISPHKQSRSAEEARHRLAMLRLATRNESRYNVSNLEVQRSGLSYAIDTVRDLRGLHPRADLFWLIGADQLEKLPTWRSYDDLCREITFASVDRAVEDGADEVPDGVVRLPLRRRIDISSTEIRQRVAAGLSVEYFVPAVVREYIERERLYLPDDEATPQPLELL